MYQNQQVKMISLLWLRRDLRLRDNFSLFLSLLQPEKIQPIFVFDQHILSRFTNHDDKRISFIFDSLRAIDKELKTKDSELLVFYGKLEILLPKINHALKVKTVFAGKDYEPYGIKRDNIINRELDLQLNNDHLLIAPDKIYKDDGSSYKIFTPYFKKWQSQIEPLDYAEYNNKNDYNRYADSNQIKYNLAQQNIHTIDLNEDLLDLLDYRHQRLDDWPLDQLSNRFKHFIENKLSSYANERDNLDDSTSRFSPYLRFGQLSIRQCYRAALNIENNQQWITELAWRDFYAMILYHNPETISLEMQPQYRNIQWSKDLELLAQFTSAQTGYPVVDAAIKQLLNTGWMHNRARMIVASFMTKNLWLDWRLGEEFFAQHLMDYELSSNVGGWQWSASVGVDAQPYFRVFNPYIQSKKFDPNGNYIRKYLPELRLLSNDEIHKPKSLSLLNNKYYAPIIDYETSRKKAIEYFKKLRYEAKQSMFRRDSE